MVSVPISRTDLENRYRTGWETAQQAARIPQEKYQLNVGWVEASNPTPAHVTLPLTHPTNNCASLLIPHRVRSRI